jgi:hypothetical protein
MTVDHEFIKVLTRVVIVGGSIGIAGTIILIFAMRAFRGEEVRGALLVAGLLFFVLICCVVLLQFSFVK